MNELLDAIERNRKILKHRFYFRLAFLIAPIICLIWLIVCKSVILSDLESNIVLGLLVSFLAWSITELYTLCLSIEIQYKNEENYFLTGWYKFGKGFKNIADTLTNGEKSFLIPEILTEKPANEKSKVFWRDLCHWSNEINGYLGGCILKYPNYTLNEKFRYAICYNWRLFWLISAHLYNNKCDSKGLYEKLIDESLICKSVDSIESIKAFNNSFHGFIDVYESMKDLSLNGENYTPPDEVYTREAPVFVVRDGITEIGNGKSEYRGITLVYKPYQVLLEYLKQDSSMNNICCIFKLMKLCKIYNSLWNNIYKKLIN